MLSPLEHLAALGALMDSLGVQWVLGGSMASSVVGEPRSTIDIDVAVALDLDHVDRLLAAVSVEYYVDADAAREAVVRHESFNLIHFQSSVKIDLFPLSDDPLDVRQLTNRQRVEVTPGVMVWVGAAADQVLRKLRWFQLGGQVLERQWRDVLSILRIQGDRIDHDALLDDARELGLGDLVARALAES